jgi:hypothetical protein
MFNPDPRIETVTIDGQNNCYVIDDALAEPERWVDYAARLQHEFRIEDFNAYPGPELRMPDAVSKKLDEYFMLYIRRRLGARRTLRMYSRLAIATAPPASLQPNQWICHRDRMGVPPGQCVAASVLYLFKDAGLGGTGFFKPRLPPFETDLLVHESGELPAAEFSARYGLSAGYMTQSNRYFEKLCTVPARWNRIIFYDGCLFHCSDISMPERLTADPRSGRLTLNGFFTCSRELRL